MAETASKSPIPSPTPPVATEDPIAFKSMVEKEPDKGAEPSAFPNAKDQPGATNGEVAPHYDHGRRGDRGADSDDAAPRSVRLRQVSAAVVAAENHPPPLELASREQPPAATSTPAPSTGPHGVQPSVAASVESQPLEEQHQAPISSTMVVPVKSSDSPDAKQRTPEAASNSPSPHCVTPTPPASNGDDLTSSKTTAGDNSEMGAEGSKLGSGKFCKAASTDVQPMEEKAGVAKRSASSSAGFFTRNGRGSTSASDATNGHRESVHSLTEEVERIVSEERPESSAGHRSSPRPESSPTLSSAGKDPTNVMRKSPVMGPPSPIPADIRPNVGERASSKSPSPDLIKAHSGNSPIPKSKTVSPTEKHPREALKTKTPSPDIDVSGRGTPDSRKFEATRGKSPLTDEGVDVKSPSPDMLKTKSTVSPGIPRNSPLDHGKPDKALTADGGRAELANMGSTGRKTPGSDVSRSKSPSPLQNKTPDLGKTGQSDLSEAKRTTPDISTPTPNKCNSPDIADIKTYSGQSKSKTPSPEPAKPKLLTPDIPEVPASPNLEKSHSPPLNKGSIKLNETNSNTTADKDSNISQDIKRNKSPTVEVKKVDSDMKLGQKSVTPEFPASKSPSPDLTFMRSQQKTPDLTTKKEHLEQLASSRIDNANDTKAKSPESLPKSSTPDIPKSKPITPEPQNSKPLTPEPPKSKPSTPEPSKITNSSLDALGTDMRRSNSRLPNSSNSDLKESKSPTNAISKSPSPELLASRKTTPDLPNSKSPSPEMERLGSSRSDLKEINSGIIEPSKTPSAALEGKMDDAMKSKSSTPEPLKTKSPSQESIKSDHFPPSSPRPESSASNTLRRRPSSQKLSSKSPSPETGHRPPSNPPPSVPPSPEPLKLSPSASPDLIPERPLSRTNELRKSVSPELGVQLAANKRADLKSQTDETKSPSPNTAKHLNSNVNPESQMLSEEVSYGKTKSPVEKLSPSNMEIASNRAPTPQNAVSPLDVCKSASPPNSVDGNSDLKTLDTPASGKPEKSQSPTSPTPTKSTSPAPSKESPRVSTRSPTPAGEKTKPSTPPKSPLPPGDPLGKTAVVRKPGSPDNGQSPDLSKPPSPNAEKVSSQTTSQSRSTDGPVSPLQVKSPSPSADGVPNSDEVKNDTVKADSSPISKSPRPNSTISPECNASPTALKLDKSPSPEPMVEQKQKSPSPTGQSRVKRPDSRHGVTPELALSPSEDSGRTSASPDHFERKSSASPKPTSPMPSSRSAASPRVLTPTSPSGPKRSESAIDGQKTPDLAITPADNKATAVSSPTSEVGDEASRTTSRTGSARPSSTEAATPDEEAKTSGGREDKTLAVAKAVKGEAKEERKDKGGNEEAKKKKAESSKPGTPSRTPRSSRSVVPSPRTPRRTTPRSRRKDADHDKGSSGNRAKSEEKKGSTNGEVLSPTKKSPTKIPAAKKSPSTPNAATSSPARPPLKSPAKSGTKTPPAVTPAPEPEKKKVPMNKVQVGTAASPNLKSVRSKIGSLDNAAYKPGGGKVKIENRKLDFSKTAPKIAAKNDAYVPGGGDKKIQQVKLTWSAKPKVGSLDNATYKPGGGEKKIETVKLDFKDKAKPKVGSKDNIKHAPGGGTVKKTTGVNDDTNSDIECQKVEFKAQSKIGSMDNVKHKPGGGERKIFDDKNYLKQVGGSSSKASSEGVASGAQSPVPPMSPQRFSEENSVEES